MKRKIKDRFNYYFIFKLSFCFFLFISTLSCVRSDREATKAEQKRGIEGKFAPGTTDDKYNINIFKVMNFPSDQLDESLLKGRSLRIKTKKTGQKVPVSVSMKEVTINSQRSFLKSYYLVDYDILPLKTDTETILSKLVGKIDDFRGFPGTVYHIVPHVYNNYLILYRISDREKLPYIEVPLSIKVGHKVATPLVGYPIEYCIPKKILDNNNKETGQYDFKCKDVKKEDATHVRLIENKSVFSYVPKVDIFPSDFFKGDWFFVGTIIKSSGDQSTGGLGRHQDFQNAALIEFEKTADSLKTVDTHQYQLDEKDKSTSFSIPVEWKEYKMAGDSGTLDKYKFSEEEKTTTADIERPYFIIKFNKLAEGDNTEIGKINIEDDYFSFVIKIRGEKNIWLKYAFKKAVANKKYVQKRWFEKDSTLFFPAFQVIRKYYRTVRDHTEQDKEKYIRTTRFDPRSHNGGNVKIIKWYFSKQTPPIKWVRDFGHTAVDYWDKVFQEAGKDSEYKIRIVLCDPHNPSTLCNENEDKELGDIRYNILNLMYSEEGESSQLLGYGPNISNPITGETLSATANVWVHTIVGQYVTLLRRYIRFRVYPPAWKLLPESPGVTDFIDSKIKKICSDVTAFILFEQEKKEVFDPIHSRLDDADIVWNCAKKIAEVDILNTTLHEMGHGFAYRHVFTGSTDEGNFYNNYDEIKSIFGQDIDVASMDGYPDLPQYSTVMDYAHPYFPGMSVPGKYDIAVTKFVYFDQVELEGGEVLHVPAGEEEQKPILDIIEEAGVRVKRYKVCGGDITSDMDLDNPLCAQHDYGVTPKEIIDNMIRVHQDHIMVSRKRYDSDFINFPVIQSKDFGIKTVFKIARIINKMNKYARELTGRRNMRHTDYFFLNEDKIAEYENLLKTEADTNPEFKLYYDARDSIFDYFEKLFFLPVKHCVYERSEGKYKAIALEVIKKRIESNYPDGSRKIFMDCESPVIQEWASNTEQEWASNTEQGKLITEVGYFAEKREYFLKPTSDDPYDEMPIFSAWLLPRQTLRSLAIEYFKEGEDVRKHLLHSHWVDILVSNNMMLSLLSNPTFTRRIINEMREYVLNGVNLNPYLNRDNIEDKYRDINVPRVLSYEAESMAISLLNPQAEIAERHQHPGLYGLFGIRLAVIENFSAVSLVPFLNAEDEDQLNRYYLHGSIIDTTKLNEINNLVKNNDVDSLSAEQIPFLLEAYEEYKDIVDSTSDVQPIEQSALSFVTFLRNHSLVCTIPGLSVVLIPYNSTNVTAKMCKNLNLYKECIDMHSADQPCENIEDKKIHNRYISDVMKVAVQQ